MRNDKRVIEDCLIAAMLRSLIAEHCRKDPDTERSYSEAISVLDHWVSQFISGRDKQLQRRLSRIVYKISSYFVQNKFTTRKAFLCISEWCRALMEQDAFIVQPGSLFWGLLEDIGTVIQCGYEQIEDFDKIDASALKHVNAIHKIAEEEGYFV